MPPLINSPGTAASTVLVRDINPGSRSSGSAQPINVGGTLFLLANDGSNGLEFILYSWPGDSPLDGKGRLRF